MPTALITGISRGIGLAIAKAFDAHGYTIVGTAKQPERLSEVQKAHPQWHLAPADLVDQSAVQAFGAWALNQRPQSGIDILIHNAGSFQPGGILTEAQGAFQTMMTVNLESAYHLTRVIAPHMVAHGRGTICTICSTASLQGYPNGASYCIAKHGLLGMTRALREELKPTGVRVIAVLPGPTHTDSWAGTNLPPERFMQPDTVAAAVFAACTLPADVVVEEIILRPQLGDIS